MNVTITWEYTYMSVHTFRRQITFVFVASFKKEAHKI
jgi:hypothetical protein